MNGASWTFVRRVVLLLSVVAVLTAGLVVVTQTLQLAAMAAQLHPLAGRALLWGLVATYALCLAVPVYLWLRLPPPLAPPATEDDPAFPAHLARLGRRLAENRHVPPGRFETRAEIEQGLARLDERAEQVVRDAAGRVFLTTAISQYGALDAVMVLGLQTRLVWNVAHVYAQRPSLRDLTALYANVIGTAFVAGELEEAELSEYVQPMIASVLGSAPGLVPGLAATSSVLVQSIVSGAANTFLALRVGILAQQYSRGLVRPERRRLRGLATRRAAGLLGAIVSAGAGKVSAAVARASGRTMSRAMSGVGRTVRDAGKVAYGTITRTRARPDPPAGS